MKHYIVSKVTLIEVQDNKLVSRYPSNFLLNTNKTLLIILTHKLISNTNARTHIHTSLQKERKSKERFSFKSEFKSEMMSEMMKSHDSMHL